MKAMLLNDKLKEKSHETMKGQHAVCMEMYVLGSEERGSELTLNRKHQFVNMDLGRDTGHFS
jgi:hypothetical protein